jgi:hypothetical protein
MIPSATKVAGVTGPQSEHPATQYFCKSMIENYKIFGVTRGATITMADQPPSGLDTTMKEIMQEVLTGKRDVDALLTKLDNAWDSLRKAETAR